MSTSPGALIQNTISPATNSYKILSSCQMIIYAGMAWLQLSEQSHAEADMSTNNLVSLQMVCTPIDCSCIATVCATIL